MKKKIIYGFVAFFAVLALLLSLATPTTPLFSSGVVEINDLFETGTGLDTGFDPGDDIQRQQAECNDRGGPAEPQDDPGEDGDAPPDSTGGDTGGY